MITYLHQTALALDRTHKASIVHRDLKPQNLFLTAREDGVPHIKVLDFGIAKILADTAAGGATTTTFGTPLYMAPEQFVTDSGITPAADIFALGMIVRALVRHGLKHASSAIITFVVIAAAFVGIGYVAEKAAVPDVSDVDVLGALPVTPLQFLTCVAVAIFLTMVGILLGGDPETLETTPATPEEKP